MDDNLNNFASELRDLLKKHKMELGVEIDGDLYGINIEGFVAVDQTGKEHMLSEYNQYLDVHNLDELLGK